MKLNKSATCCECKYYTDSIGENGYCKFYRHNISTPDVTCSNFEKAESLNTLNTKDINPDSEAVVHETHKNILIDRKTALKRLLLTASVFSCLVFAVLSAIFAVTIGTAIMSFGDIDLTMRIVFLVTVCLFQLSLLLLACMLAYRFTAMRIFFIVASLLCVAFMLLNNTLLWFNFHDFVMNLVEEIFNIVY